MSKIEYGFIASSIYLDNVYTASNVHQVISQKDVCYIYSISQPYLRKWLKILNPLQTMYRSELYDGLTIK